MHIKKMKIEGFKTFRKFELALNKHFNIIVGDNETGKTTLLEAINLVLSCQLDGRNIQYELNPYIFNVDMVKDYLKGLKEGENLSPPQIFVEAYLEDDESSEMAKVRGSNNSEGESCPGLRLSVELTEGLADEFREYFKASETPDIMPIEYYTVVWHDFAGNPVATRNLPFRAKIIDTSLVSGYSGPNKYVSRIIADVLGEDQRLLSIGYRKLKHLFMKEAGIEKINKHLADKKGDVTNKRLTVSMDMSARSKWESSITAHLDDIPFDSVGKGEQCRVQMKLAIEAAGGSNVLLIEEPENHLSHSNMNRLLQEIIQRGADRQIILTTHSNFVLNKLGIDNLKLLSVSGDTMTLEDLSEETKEYFMKLPGYDTLRVILSAKTILVEGPSDELIVQKAYKVKYGKLPLEDGVDVVSVRSLAFKRFLEIGKLLKLNIRVVTDNDGNVRGLKDKYKDYIDGKVESIRICYDDDENSATLEPQLLKANSLKVLNAVVGRTFQSDDELLDYMGKNKTDSALKVFGFQGDLTFPQYINNAIQR
ncbi:MAG TPA: AAA family ATPase [Sedimentisphaerales bacterium]|nr:AAA family ATPase [Sedimentisphaerales bacterium]